MSKKQEPAGVRRIAAADPTLPATTVTLDGTDYRLCFDLGALAEAEKEINKRGIPFSFAEDLGSVTRIVPICCFFAAGLRRLQPKMTFEQGYQLVTPVNFLVVCGATSTLLARALRGPEPDPTEAPAPDVTAVAGDAV